ncbi:winged helix-turn-helix transcriptional regulator [Staphylococcus simulans]
MTSRQYTNENTCPSRIVIDLLKGKFAIEVLAEVINGSNHYGELLRNINGINPRILAMRLREFEHSGILTRTVLPLNPPQVIYNLTEKGIALKKITDEMNKWHKIYY